MQERSETPTCSPEEHDESAAVEAARKEARTALEPFIFEAETIREEEKRLKETTGEHGGKKFRRDSVAGLKPPILEVLL